MSKLSDALPPKPNYIPDKEAELNMGALDIWIDNCESHCKSRAGVAGMMPEHDQLIAECLDSIALLKKFRSSIQSAEQSWWALAMCSALVAQEKIGRLFDKSDRHLKLARARLKKLEIELKRRRWLSKHIRERELTAADLLGLGSGKKPKRKRLFGEYHELFGKGPKTFTADVKIIFDVND